MINFQYHVLILMSLGFLGVYLLLRYKERQRKRARVHNAIDKAATFLYAVNKHLRK